MKRIHRIFGMALVLLLLPLLGCGGVGKGTLAGSVQYKGKPVLTGTVTAFDAKKTPYQGAIEQGKYSIANIPEGEVILIVVSPNPADDPTRDGGRDGGGREGGRERGRPMPDGGKPAPPAPGWFPIPAKHGDMATSQLKTKVTKGNNDYPITLTD